MNERRQLTEGEIQFDGTTETVEGSSAALSVQALESTFSQLGRGLDSNSETVVKLRPFSRGSFVIPFFVETWVPDVHLLDLPKDISAYFFRGIVDYFNARVFLRGKPPVSFRHLASEVEIENLAGEMLTVSSAAAILLDRRVGDADEKFQLVFAQLRSDGDIRSFVLRARNLGEIVRVSREEYAYFADAERIVGDERISRTVERRETLRIVSLSFDPSLKWRFQRFGQHRIAALVEDEEFLDKLESEGEPFRFNDVLEVEVRCEQSRTGDDAIWIDNPSSYVVTRVLRHFRPPLQDTLL